MFAVCMMLIFAAGCITVVGVLWYFVVEWVELYCEDYLYLRSEIEPVACRPMPEGVYFWAKTTAAQGFLNHLCKELNRIDPTRCRRCRFGGYYVIRPHSKEVYDQLLIDYRQPIAIYKHYLHYREV